MFRIWVGGVLAIKEVRVRRWVDFGEKGEGMVGGWGRGEGGAEGGGFEWRGWLKDGVVEDGLNEGVFE